MASDPIKPTMDGCPVTGFIGLGQMGGAIALRLLGAGHPLIVFDTDPAAVGRLVAAGATAAQSAMEIGDSAGTVLACLPTSEISLAVATDVSAGRAVRHYVEMSTVGPDAARGIAAALAARDIIMVDAPVSGGPSAAQAGGLSVIVSGAPAAADAVAPLLDAVGRVFLVGAAPGMAQLAKLANNALSLVGMVLASEAMVLGVKAGLDAQVLLEVINASTGRNSATMDKFPRAVLTRTFDYGGPLAAAPKDLSLFIREAERLGVPVGVTAEGARHWQAAAAEGDPQRDFTTIIQRVERAAGVIVGAPACSEDTKHV